MSFGDRLNQRRKEKGLNQEDVTAFFCTDISRQSVSKWERGEAFPEADKILVLAVKLDMSLDELFSDELSYLKRKKVTADEDTSYLGLVAGLKTLANALSQYK